MDIKNTSTRVEVDTSVEYCKMNDTAPINTHDATIETKKVKKRKKVILLDENVSGTTSTHQTSISDLIHKKRQMTLDFFKSEFKSDLDLSKLTEDSNFFIKNQDTLFDSHTSWIRSLLPNLESISLMDDLSEESDFPISSSRSHRNEYISFLQHTKNVNDIETKIAVSSGLNLQIENEEANKKVILGDQTAKETSFSSEANELKNHFFLSSMSTHEKVLQQWLKDFHLNSSNINSDISADINHISVESADAVTNSFNLVNKVQTQSHSENRLDSTSDEIMIDDSLILSQNNSRQPLLQEEERAENDLQFDDFDNEADLCDEEIQSKEDDHDAFQSTTTSSSVPLSARLQASFCTFNQILMQKEDGKSLTSRLQPPSTVSRLRRLQRTSRSISSKSLSIRDCKKWRSIDQDNQHAAGGAWWVLLESSDEESIKLRQNLHSKVSVSKDQKQSTLSKTTAASNSSLHEAQLKNMLIDADSVVPLLSASFPLASFPREPPPVSHVSLLRPPSDFSSVLSLAQHPFSLTDALIALHPQRVTDRQVREHAQYAARFLQPDTHSLPDWRQKRNAVRELHEPGSKWARSILERSRSIADHQAMVAGESLNAAAVLRTVHSDILDQMSRLESSTLETTIAAAESIQLSLRLETWRRAWFDGKLRTFLNSDYLTCCELRDLDTVQRANGLQPLPSLEQLVHSAFAPVTTSLSFSSNSPLISSVAFTNRLAAQDPLLLSSPLTVSCAAAPFLLYAHDHATDVFENVFYSRADVERGAKLLAASLPDENGSLNPPRERTAEFILRANGRHAPAGPSAFAKVRNRLEFADGIGAEWIRYSRRRDLAASVDATIRANGGFLLEIEIQRSQKCLLVMSPSASLSQEPLPLAKALLGLTASQPKDETTDQFNEECYLPTLTAAIEGLPVSASVHIMLCELMRMSSIALRSAVLKMESQQQDHLEAERSCRFWMNIHSCLFLAAEEASLRTTVLSEGKNARHVNSESSRVPPPSGTQPLKSALKKPESGRPSCMVSFPSNASELEIRVNSKCTSFSMTPAEFAAVSALETSASHVPQLSLILLSLQEETRQLKYTTTILNKLSKRFAKHVSDELKCNIENLASTCIRNVISIQNLIESAVNIILPLLPSFFLCPPNSSPETILQVHQKFIDGFTGVSALLRSLSLSVSAVRTLSLDAESATTDTSYLLRKIQSKLNLLRDRDITISCTIKKSVVNRLPFHLPFARSRFPLSVPIAIINGGYLPRVVHHVDGVLDGIQIDAAHQSCLNTLSSPLPGSRLLYPSGNQMFKVTASTSPPSCPMTEVDVLLNLLPDLMQTVSPAAVPSANLQGCARSHEDIAKAAANYNSVSDAERVLCFEGINSALLEKEVLYGAEHVRQVRKMTMKKRLMAVPSSASPSIVLEELAAVNQDAVIMQLTSNGSTSHINLWEPIHSRTLPGGVVPDTLLLHRRLQLLALHDSVSRCMQSAQAERRIATHLNSSLSTLNHYASCQKVLNGLYLRRVEQIRRLRSRLEPLNMCVGRTVEEGVTGGKKQLVEILRSSLTADISTDEIERQVKFRIEHSEEVTAQEREKNKLKEGNFFSRMVSLVFSDLDRIKKQKKREGSSMDNDISSNDPEYIAGQKKIPISLKTQVLRDEMATIFTAPADFDSDQTLLLKQQQQQKESPQDISESTPLPVSPPSPPPCEPAVLKLLSQLESNFPSIPFPTRLSQSLAALASLSLRHIQSHNNLHHAIPAAAAVSLLPLPSPPNGFAAPESELLRRIVFNLTANVLNNIWRPIRPFSPPSSRLKLTPDLTFPLRSVPYIQPTNFEKFIGPKMSHLKIGISPIAGGGAFALRDLPAHTPLIEYQGIVVPKYATEFLETEYLNRGCKSTYLFAQGDFLSNPDSPYHRFKTVMDATLVSNSARFLNHSCSPNCTTRALLDENGEWRVIIFTIESVMHGQELLYDYRLESTGFSREICRCGSEVCRGFM